MNHCPKCKRDLPEGEKCPVCEPKKGVWIDMEMPKRCSACRFCSWIDGEGCADDYYACAASGDFLGVSIDEEKRHPKCPLKECK